MQDYDHWDALVIGEWPPGRSGPPGRRHTPSLPVILIVVLFPFLLSVYLFMSCLAVGLSSIFHSRRGGNTRMHVGRYLHAI